tara:strand:+ start:14317 stop:14763 length:447 start_codon:yes stop_codon:yes gene_type:complete
MASITNKFKNININRTLENYKNGKDIIKNKILNYHKDITISSTKKIKFCLYLYLILGFIFLNLGYYYMAFDKPFFVLLSFGLSLFFGYKNFSIIDSKQYNFLIKDIKKELKENNIDINNFKELFSKTENDFKNSKEAKIFLKNYIEKL